MAFRPEQIPYRDSEGNIIDFEKKRLQFWLETVPPEIRRWEYDLWKRYRKLHHARFYRFSHMQKHGRFTTLPEFTNELDEQSWEQFGESFLRGEEKQERFQEIIDHAKQDLPGLLKEHKTFIPKNKIQLVALTGSSMYGPRRKEEHLSDVDLNFLLEEKSNRFNFEIMPEIPQEQNKIPYHLTGTGTNDSARNERSEIHWLLYPHFPIMNSLPDEKLKDIIGDLVLSTQKREDEILSSIKNLDSQLKETSETNIIG